MKVCMLTTSYPRYEGDFAGAFLAHICKGLGQLGVEMSVVVPNDTQSKRYERHASLTIRRFNYFITRYQKVAYGHGGIPVNLKDNPWLVFLLPFFLYAFFANVFTIARRSDLIHVNWIPTGYMCVAIKLILGKPLILTVRGKDVYLYQNNRRFFHLLSRIFFPHIDLFTTVSEEFADFLKNEGLVKPEKVFVVPNGVSDVEIETGHLKRHKHQHGIPKDGFKAIYVGSLIKLKGVGWLIHAWKFVVKEYPNAKLLIVGEGDDRKNLETMVKEFNLEKNTIFYGYQQTHTIPYWLACADILVLPSLFEGRPNVLLEAFQGRLPVVATNIAGIGELVQDGVNGFLVPRKDPEALADKILKLFSSEKLRKEMGKAGKESIRERGLTWKNCAGKYYRLYKHLLNT